MGISRRAALQTVLAAGATAIAGATPATAAERPEAPADAVGLLYDATLCIGCKACNVACKEANDLPPDPGDRDTKLYDMPIDLSARTKTVIKLYKASATDYSYVKVQCMHCVDPACASACMLGAMKKREFGIVSYDPDLCVGCRYCEVACPYNVPRFEFSKALPKIVKCELCRHRLAKGQQPACTEVCPRKAVIFGRRADLLREAHRRLEAEPTKYVPKVFGETEGGGTQVLYLSHVPFEQLGFPALGEASAPALTRSIQHGVYRGFFAPAALYAVLGAVIFRNRRHPSEPEERGERS